MKPILGLLWLLATPAFAAEHDHSAHLPAASEPAASEPTAPAAEHDHAAMVAPEAGTPAVAATVAEQDHSAHTAAGADTVVRDNSPAMQEARHMNLMMHGDSLNFLVLGERFEQAEDDGITTRLLEMQGWVGYDRAKLWLKSEGSYDVDASETERSEIQALYSRAVAPYWDVQAGLRRDDKGSTTRTQAVFGLQGLAPNWFEVDTAAFLSEQGVISARVETEYDMRFTQRLLLQSRIELNYSFADDPGLGIGEGMSEASFGLRLRYEVRREIAPYLGVEWSRAYGNTVAFLEAAGHDREELNLVLGLRFWY